MAYVSVLCYKRAYAADEHGTGLGSCVTCLCMQWVIDTPYPSMMHDCGLTKNYAVLLHLPLTIDGKVSSMADT